MDMGRLATFGHLQSWWLPSQDAISSSHAGCRLYCVEVCIFSLSLPHISLSKTSRNGDENVRIDFDEPQKAVALGQTAAIWDGEWCLGSGIISQTT